MDLNYSILPENKATGSDEAACDSCPGNEDRHVYYLSLDGLQNSSELFRKNLMQYWWWWSDYQTMLRVDRSMPHQGNRDSLVKGAQLNWRQICLEMLCCSPLCTVSVHSKSHRVLLGEQKQPLQWHDCFFISNTSPVIYVGNTTSCVSVMLALCLGLFYLQSADSYN